MLHIFESCGLARRCTTSQPPGQKCVACTWQAPAHAQASCMLQPRAWLQHAHGRTSCTIPAKMHQVCPQARSKADWLVRMGVGRFANPQECTHHGAHTSVPYQGHQQCQGHKQLSMPLGKGVANMTLTHRFPKPRFRSQHTVNQTMHLGKTLFHATGEMKHSWGTNRDISKCTCAKMRC